LDAFELASSRLKPSERILILGATGWFGSSADSLCRQSGAQVLLRSTSGNSLITDGTIRKLDPDFQACLDFKPTIVFDCAFLTRDKIRSAGINAYIRENRMLTDQALRLRALNSVERFIAISSGAALPHLNSKSFDLQGDPYGALKARYEQDLMGANFKLKDNVVLLRAWSMSGRHARNGHLYGFFDLIAQSRTSEMRIAANSLVFRRYADVEDFLAVGLHSRTGEFPIDSGGPLLEIQELAETIKKVLGSHAIVIREVDPTGADRYHSDGLTWERAVADSGLMPKSIHEQITYSSGLDYRR
jgi:nucleoside-diphosphate-sugar epimerase